MVVGRNIAHGLLRAHRCRPAGPVSRCVCLSTTTYFSLPSSTASSAGFSPLRTTPLGQLDVFHAWTTGRTLSAYHDDATPPSSSCLHAAPPRGRPLSHIGPCIEGRQLSTLQKMSRHMSQRVRPLAGGRGGRLAGAEAHWVDVRGRMPLRLHDACHAASDVRGQGGHSVLWEMAVREVRVIPLLSTGERVRRVVP